jgi:hypothetical protein
MQFRWVAFIALWTCFIGPILGAPSKPPGKVSVATAKVTKASAVRSAAH